MQNPFPASRNGKPQTGPRRSPASLGAIDAGFEDGASPLPQVMIGDPDYYDRWQFTAAHTQGWHCPGPFEKHRLLARSGNPAILPAEGMLGPWSLAN